MNNPNITIVDAETGLTIVREMTDEEVAVAEQALSNFEEKLKE